MQSLEGKAAIVTGAGRYRGIGRHIALALARHGADVVVTGSGRPLDSLPEEEKAMGWRDVESVAEEIRSLGRRALPLDADLRRADEAQRVAEETLREMGRIDILVNNAAAGRGRDRVRIVDLEESEWRRVLEVNLTGTFLVTRAVGRVMMEQNQGGSIVNMSSVLGRRGMANNGAYATTKAGIIAFTQVLAAEMAPYRINVNTVCPGLVDTYRMDDVMRHEAVRENVLRMIPLGRACRPEEVGELVAYLCSPEGSYIHGQTITIDGGMLMG